MTATQTEELQGAGFYPTSGQKAMAGTFEHQTSSPLTEGPIVIETVDRFKIKRRRGLGIFLTPVDTESLANIIQWRVLEKDKLTGIIVPATKHLAGFNLASMTTQGEILLLTNAKGVMKTTLLEVVDGDKGYNIILVRPWLHDMKVVPSTYHQLLKFPMPEGIKQIRGEQLTVRETNAILVSSSKGKEHKA
uniref:Uncharacterized protein n=1 Tax=Nicotiana tabacum TaxID=4097 RepID=A0A1S3YI71_TOBAC|nr:PREDICTED: uncharacterized protein LOC107776541 [Nicotiana tabacum]